MASKNHDRDNCIYDEWIGGKTLRQLAKDYDMSVTRIVNITHHVRFERENPNHVVVMLERLYPEMSPGMIRGSVNPVLRYFSCKDRMPNGKIPRATTEYFFNCLDRMSFDDIPKLKNIGAKKAEFLKNLKMGGLPIKVSM